MWKLKSHLLCLFLTCVNKVDASFHDGDAIRTLLVTCPSIIGCFAFYYCFIGHLSNDVSQPAFSAVFFKMNPCFSSRQPHPDFHRLFQMRCMGRVYNLTLCISSLFRIACFRLIGRSAPKNETKIRSRLSCREVAKCLHFK